MIIDISAKVKRLIMAGLPLAMLGCGGATMPLCFEKQILPISGDRALVTLAFDPEDPRWADFYQECGRNGRFCSQLCQELFNASPSRGQGGGSESGCAVRCVQDGKVALATLQFNGGTSGRRPPGYVAVVSDAPGTSVGRYFADCAALEAASIPAFRLLARELEAHAAPAALVRRARAAMKEEARHFRQMRQLARRYGGPAPVRPNPPLPPLRGLDEIASHNAAEGCVLETFSAIVAGWQAETAADPVIRETMTAVANDETAHAQLAWDVHAWAVERLNPAGKAAVIKARAQAARQLVTSAAAPVETDLVRQAGLPSPHMARWLAAQAAATLWS
jgi:hypothetical protein